jgi:hypothetical protein
MSSHPHPAPLHGYLRQTEAVLGHDARDRVHLIRRPEAVNRVCLDFLDGVRP